MLVQGHTPSLQRVGRPAIFERFMDMTISELLSTYVSLGDIVVSGASREDHARKLEVVFDPLKISNMRFSSDKSKCKVAEVSFLGYKVDVPGIHTTGDKARAIVDEPPPISKLSWQRAASHSCQEPVPPAPAEESCPDLGGEAPAGVSGPPSVANRVGTL